MQRVQSAKSDAFSLTETEHFAPFEGKNIRTALPTMEEGECKKKQNATSPSPHDPQIFSICIAMLHTCPNGAEKE